MKKLLIIIALSVGIIPAYSQIGVRGLKQYASTGTPSVLGNATGGSLVIFLPSFSERIEARGDIEYMKYNIQFPVIPSYNIDYDGLIPKEYKLDTASEWDLSVGMNFNAINRDVFKTYLGAEYVMGFFTSTATINDNTTSTSSYVHGFRLRLGVSYFITPALEPFAETAYIMKKYNDFGNVKSIAFSIGIKFIFNEF